MPDFELDKEKRDINFVGSINIDNFDTRSRNFTRKACPETEKGSNLSCSGMILFFMEAFICA